MLFWSATAPSPDKASTGVQGRVCNVMRFARVCVVALQIPTTCWRIVTLDTLTPPGTPAVRIDCHKSRCGCVREVNSDTTTHCCMARTDTVPTDTVATILLVLLTRMESCPRSPIVTAALYSEARALLRSSVRRALGLIAMP